MSVQYETSTILRHQQLEAAITNAMEFLMSFVLFQYLLNQLDVTIASINATQQMFHLVGMEKMKTNRTKNGHCEPIGYCNIKIM